MTFDLRRVSRLAAPSVPDPVVQPLTAERQPDVSSALVLALIAVVVVLDQAAKWWAWRHVPWAKINSGGDLLVGSTIGGWYARPASGALLDLLDFGLVSIAVMCLLRVRGRAAALVTIPCALMIGGWGSNLLDRLGIHYLTAPDSVRGVVDFIHVAGEYYNVADVFIITCTPLFLLAVMYQGVRAAMRPAGASLVPPRARRQVQVRRPAWKRVPALAAAGATVAGLVLVVALGAANYGGVMEASCAPVHQELGADSAWTALTGWPDCLRPHPHGTPPGPGCP